MSKVTLESEKKKSKKQLEKDQKLIEEKLNYWTNRKVLNKYVQETKAEE